MKEIIYLWATNIAAFLDRKYNLIFNKKNCVRIVVQSQVFRYNDIVFVYESNFRCLGKDWYVTYKTKRT